MLGNQNTFGETLDIVEYWVPKKAYGHENKFRDELKRFLDRNLNHNRDAGGILGGMKRELPVTSEHGKAKGDVVVDDVVGIELKRDFSNDQKNKLEGQINSYLDNYPFVIVCACGINDIDGWRELKNKYEGVHGMAMQEQEVVFVHKRKEHFGKDPEQLRRGGGGLFGDGLL